MKPRDFIAAIGPSAQSSAKTTGIPASFTVAQAALESGWGESRLAREGRNVFGIKADPAWTGPTVDMPTREYVNGAWVQQVARWRAYSNWQGSIDDHAAFFRRNSRYARCFECSTGEGWAQAVAQAGYATDPQYAGKLVQIMREHHLEQLDTRPDVAPKPSIFGALGALMDLFKWGRSLANGATLQNRVALAAGITGFLTAAFTIAKALGYDTHLSTQDLQDVGGAVAVLICVLAPLVRVLGSENAGFGRPTAVPVLSDPPGAGPDRAGPGSNA